MARKAQILLLYADSSVKDAAQVAVKTALWAMVDSLESFGSASSEGPSWASLSPFLKEAMAVWRQAPASVQATSPIVALAAQECSPAGKRPGKKRARASASSSSSSSSSNSSGSSSSTSSSESSASSWEEVEPIESALLARFGHGPGPTDKIHFLTEEGSMPGCARGVVPDSDGYGVGADAILVAGRMPCRSCCAKFATTPEDLLARCRRDD